MGDKWYRHVGHAIVLTLHVQPGAKRTEVAGHHGDALKVRLAAPPIEGRANHALQKYVAGLFEVPLRQVTLLKGEKSNHKVILVEYSKIEPGSIITS